MAGDQWTAVSARFEEWRDAALVAAAAGAEPVLVTAGTVRAERTGSRTDVCVRYDDLPDLTFSRIELSGDRWRAALRDGTEVERARTDERNYQETGILFLLDPGDVLLHSEVLDERVLADGTRELRLREPQEAVVMTRDGHLVDYGKPQPRWRHIADDVSFSGADAYVAVQEPAHGLLVRWDALQGDRLLRRFAFVDVAFDRSDPAC